MPSPTGSASADCLSQIDRFLLEQETATSDRKHWEKVKQGHETTLSRLTSAKQTAEQVHSFFSGLGDTLRQELEQKVQHLVTYGLQTVFGPNYAFQVTSEFKGNSVRTEFFLVDHGTPIPFIQSAGGGITDVTAFLLRVVMLSITKPQQSPVIILDEPFKFVSREYFDNLGQLLQELTNTLGIQLIMVTHKPELIPYATTLIEVSQANQTSKAKISSTR